MKNIDFKKYIFEFYLSKCPSDMILIFVTGSRGGSRAATTSKMERFVITVNG